MGLTFIAFEGYEIIAQCSEEVRNPERNVPRAIFLSLLIVVPIYLLVAFAALGAVQPEGMPSWKYLGEHKETALVNVAETFFRGGGVLILIGGLFSTMSALNATIYSSSRVSFAMGRDRNLPSWFGKIHPLRKTPHWSILASGVLSAVDGGDAADRGGGERGEHHVPAAVHPGAGGVDLPAQETPRPAARVQSAASRRSFPSSASCCNWRWPSSCSSTARWRG